MRRAHCSSSTLEFPSSERAHSVREFTIVYEWGIYIVGVIVTMYLTFETTAIYYYTSRPTRRSRHRRTMDSWPKLAARAITSFTSLAHDEWGATCVNWAMKNAACERTRIHRPPMSRRMGRHKCE